MSILKEFVVRYRDEGHVRFQIPAIVCDSTVAQILQDGILSITGVYSVNLYRSQRKLSIRYNEVACDFKSLAAQLAQLLTDLQKSGGLVAKPKEVSPWKQKFSDKLNSFKVTNWAKEKYSDAKDTVHAAKIITNIGMKKPKAFLQDPEKAITDFFTDVLVLFMIRLHWNNITQLWIVSPFKYRYEWMAVFYMVYLLVRSRKPK
jgi:hypothetical protein